MRQGKVIVDTQRVSDTGPGLPSEAETYKSVLLMATNSFAQSVFGIASGTSGELRSQLDGFAN